MKRGAGASVFGYFWGNAKSDWHSAAMEREGGKDYSSCVRPFAALRANGGMQGSSFDEATLTLSRLREGHKTAQRQSRMGAGLR